MCFNSQPPEGGWPGVKGDAGAKGVSTHSRPKAAGCYNIRSLCNHSSFNSQPPEGGWTLTPVNIFANCCFNSQPPEGGWLGFLLQFFDVHSFNSQPPEGGWMFSFAPISSAPKFQLTAARRRLDSLLKIS